jgi:hypothetical protein
MPFLFGNRYKEYANKDKNCLTIRWRYDEKLIEEKNMEILSCMLRVRNLQVGKGLPFLGFKNRHSYSWKETTRNG